jgi:hypothetical protein
MRASSLHVLGQKYTDEVGSDIEKENAYECQQACRREASLESFCEVRRYPMRQVKRIDHYIILQISVAEPMGKRRQLT